MKRPKLNPIPLSSVTQRIANTKPSFVITMSTSQWDRLLEESYFYQNAILIEVNSEGIPIAAYQKLEEGNSTG